MDPTLSPPAPTGPLASTPPLGSPPVAPAGNGSGTGLPSVEEILQKRAGGIKLTKAEAARLSWVGRQRKPAAAPLAPRPSPGSPALGHGLADGGSEASPLPPPVDEGLCRDTAAEILETLNAAGQDSIAAKAKLAGASEETTKPFLERAALKPGQKTTLVNTAPRWLPKLVRIAGLDPENAPEAMAGIAAALWAVGFVSVSASLERMAKERPQQPPQPPPKS